MDCDLVKQTFFCLDELYNILFKLMAGHDVNDELIYKALEKSNGILHKMASEQRDIDWVEELRYGIASRRNLAEDE